MMGLLLRVLLMGKSGIRLWDSDYLNTALGGAADSLLLLPTLVIVRNLLDAKVSLSS